MRTSFLLIVVVAAFACSFSYDYTIRATLASGLAVPAGVEVVLGASSVDEGDGSIFEVGGGEDIRTSDGVTAFERESSVCCSAGGSALNIYAYVDLNGNGTWDMGEPWGADSNNPVLIDESGYVAQIQIVEDSP